jgi:hypothetical protein
MEPVINQCYPENSQGYFSLRYAKLWPFREALMLNDSLKQKYERLQQIISEEDYVLAEVLNVDPCNQYWLERQDTIESLSLIVDTMTLISNCIPAVGADLRWCKLCFRRISISKTSKYCPLHAPEKKTNTKHKQGMRVANKVPPEIEAIKQRYQQLRIFLGDEPVFLNSDTTDMVDAILSGAQAAICNTHDLALYSQTLNDDWATIRSMWVNGIQMQFPHITMVLKCSNYTRVDSWNAFVLEILKALTEGVETAKHPHWILRVLIVAEAWLAHEQELGDMRPTGKKTRIYQLAEEQILPARIAEILGVDRSYVSRTLKERNK